MSAPRGLAVRLSLLLSLGLGLSCISVAPVDEDIDGFAIASDMTHELAWAVCVQREACCNGPELWFDFGLGLAGTLDCTSKVVSTLEAGVEHPAVPELDRFLLLDTAKDVGLGRVRVDETGVQACVDFLSGRTCDAYVEPSDHCLPGGYAQDDPCARAALLEGLVPAGGECRVGADYMCAEGRCVGAVGLGTCTKTTPVDGVCTLDAECDPGLYCHPAEQRCKVGAELGQICAYANPSKPLPGTELTKCAEGLTCDPIQGRCVAPCTNGALCTNEFECPEGLICAVDRCREPGDAGAPCDSPVDCVSGRCDFIVLVCIDKVPNGQLCSQHDDCESRFCDPQDGRCAEPVAVGEPCPTVTDAECKDSFCDWMVEDPGPLCRAYVEAGGVCDVEVDRCDPEYDQPLACADGRCREVPFPNGTSCPSAEWCASGICHQGVCDAGAGVNDECDSFLGSLPCGEGLFCNRVGGLVVGTCQPYLPPGAPCLEHMECYGECELRWGTLMCDDTLPPHEDAVWCDGNDNPFD